MGALKNLAIVATAILVGLILIVGLFTLFNRKRLQRRPQIPEKRRYELQAALLEAIKETSADQGTVVDIRSFWVNAGVKISQRELVIQPLIDARHVKKHDPSTGNEFFDTIREIYRSAFCLPPTHLVLTDRTWVQMVHNGISGKGIIIERVETMNWQTAGRDIVHSPQTNAGKDARVRTGEMARTGDSAGIPFDLLVDLVTALRSDAPRLPSKEEQAKVRKLANKLEQDVNEAEQDEDEIMDGVARAERYLIRAGGLMSATHKAYEALQQWLGQS